MTGMRPWAFATGAGSSPNLREDVRMKARRLAGILAAAHLALGCVLPCEAGTDDL